MKTFWALVGVAAIGFGAWIVVGDAALYVAGVVEMLIIGTVGARGSRR